MVNAILCGCGGMSHAWLDDFTKREEVKFVGLVDVFAENANKVKEQYKLDCGVYQNLQKALDALNVEGVKVDVVMDVTIPDAHFEIASTAMKAGISVLSEKPMAANLDLCRQLVDISKETGKLHAIMQNRRYLKGIRNFKEVTSPEVLGEMGILQADFFIGAHFGGFRDIMDNVLVLDMAVHTFDMARFIYGCDAVSVYCQEYNPKWSWYKGDSSAVCIFEMENGGVFIYSGSWSAEGCQTNWESNWRAHGTNGGAHWNSNTNEIYAEIIDADKEVGFVSPVKRVEPQGLWNGREGHNGCFDEMFEYFKTGAIPQTVCTDNIKTMEMVFGAIESSKRGEKVYFDKL